MSRFSDDYDTDSDVPEEFWANARYNAIHSKRGRKVVAELEASLLALPEHRLIEGHLCEPGGWNEDDEQIPKIGAHCALGAMGMRKFTAEGKTPEEAARILLEAHDPENSDEWDLQWWAQATFGLTETLAWTIPQINDVFLECVTPEQRYETFLDWCAYVLRTEVPPEGPRRERFRGLPGVVWNWRERRFDPPYKPGVKQLVTPTPEPPR